MTKLVLFNKPYGVVSQFSSSPPHLTLKDFIPISGVYPAGRLDHDSEGLMILTDNGQIQAQITEPSAVKYKTYWVQVEGQATLEHLLQLRVGVNLGEYISTPALAEIIAPPNLWQRDPPIRMRQKIPTSWLEISICEGKNRQIRKMTAKIGLPTLRLVRVAIGNIKLGDLALGKFTLISFSEFKRLW